MDARFTSSHRIGRTAHFLPGDGTTVHFVGAGHGPIMCHTIANAKLVRQAFITLGNASKTPQDLADQNAKLLEQLKKLTRNSGFGGDGFVVPTIHEVNEARALIAEVEGLSYVARAHTKDGRTLYLGHGYTGETCRTVRWYTDKESATTYITAEHAQRALNDAMDRGLMPEGTKDQDIQQTERLNEEGR